MSKWLTKRFKESVIRFAMHTVHLLCIQCMVTLLYCEVCGSILGCQGCFLNLRIQYWKGLGFCPYNYNYLYYAIVLPADMLQCGFYSFFFLAGRRRSSIVSFVTCDVKKDWGSDRLSG